MKVVIVGGGVGGIACAQRLAARDSEIEIELIDRQERHDFAPSFLWLMTGSRRPDSISRPIARLGRRGIKVTESEVTGLNLERGTVSTASDEVAYDELVLAPGAELAPDAVPGLAEGAHLFYTREGAERLRDALGEFKGGRVLITVAAMPYKCPAAPYEAAFLIDDLLRRRGVSSKIEVVTVEPQPMPVAGPEIGKAVVAMLDRRRIGFYPNRKLQSVDSQAHEAKYEDGGEPYDLLVAIPPHRAPGFVADSPLAGPQGWVPVDAKSLGAADHVHAIGDVTAITLANGKPLPKAGVFAHREGHVVADNLTALAAGKTPSARFDGHGACFLELGSGQAAYASGDFFAEPDPAVKMRRPARWWHWGKVLFEQSWLRRLR